MAEELVTGEAVALDLRVARTPSRALALLLDMLLQLMIFYFCLMFIGMSAQVSDSAVTAGLAIGAVIGVLVGYPAVCETLTRGRTLGKLALGLRVVGDDGGPERFRQALVRALAGFVELWMFIGGPALICSLLNSHGKRLGDLFAGTMVIQERVPVKVTYGPVAIMPPHLIPWAQSLELSLLPDSVATAARQYLSRFWEFVPLVRDELGTRLTRDVLSYVSPPPPAGFRPEIVLSAVLAERRVREERRLFQRASRRAAINRRGATTPSPPPPPQAVPAGHRPPPPAYGTSLGPIPEWLGNSAPQQPPQFLPYGTPQPYGQQPPPPYGQPPQPAQAPYGQGPPTQPPGPYGR